MCPLSANSGLTVSSELELDPISYSLVYSRQENLGQNTPDSSLVELAASCDLSKYLSIGGEQWSIGAGYASEHDVDGGADTHLFSILLTIDFSSGYP